jgi:hypothetical protein
MASTAPALSCSVTLKHLFFESSLIYLQFLIVCPYRFPFTLWCLFYLTFPNIF